MKKVVSCWPRELLFSAAVGQLIIKIMFCKKVSRIGLNMQLIILLVSMEQLSALNPHHEPDMEGLCTHKQTTEQRSIHLESVMRQHCLYIQMDDWELPKARTSQSPPWRQGAAKVMNSSPSMSSGRTWIKIKSNSTLYSCRYRHSYETSVCSSVNFQIWLFGYN